MNPNFKSYLILSGLFILLFIVAELLYHKAKVKAEYTRKFVHVGTGLLTLLFPLMFTQFIWVIMICTSFIALLILSLKFNFLKSINAIDRKSSGSLMYPVIVVICFYYFLQQNQHSQTIQYYYFYLPVLIMALCDPLAAIVGKNYPKWPYTYFKQTKTLSGSLAFLLLALVLCLLLFPFAHPLQLIVASSITALVACVAEAFSRNGYDNFTIPMSVVVLISFFEYLF